jgi:hypothetical protein
MHEEYRYFCFAIGGRTTAEDAEGAGERNARIEKKMGERNIGRSIPPGGQLIPHP